MKTKLLLLLVLTYSGLMAQTATSEYLFTNGDITNGVNSVALTQTGTSHSLIDGIDGLTNNGMLLNGDAFNNPSWITDGGNDNSDYSIGFWIKTDENSAVEQEIINQFSAYGWKFTLLNGNLTFRGKFFTDGTSSANQPATYTYTYNNIADDEWHYIVATLDKSAEAILGGGGAEYSRVRYKVYVDKVLVSNQEIQKVNVGNHYALQNSAQLFIGDNEDLNGNRYLGGIDNIRYYNGLLDQTDINALYTEYFARAPKAFFVNQAATGNNDGSSWTDAYTNLQDAITQADVISDEIWIVQGTYIPDASLKTKSFLINNSIKLYGGFNGTESLLSERDWRANETILSGDLSNNDTNSMVYNDASRTDNAYRVVVLNAEDVLLDGLTISGGNAMHSSINGYQKGAGIHKTSPINSINVKNCTIKNNIARTATGIYAEFSANAMVNISKCVFENNLGKHSVAYYIRSNANLTEVNIDNSLFTQNRVEDITGFDGLTGSAGSVSVNNGGSLNANISNCTIADNIENGTHTALASVGVLATARYNGNMNVEVYNTIFWNNSRLSSTTPQANSIGRITASNFANMLTISNCITPESVSGYAGTVNESIMYTSDPVWLSNTGNLRYRLPTTSPGYNTGDNVQVVNGLEGDLAGQIRIAEGTIEIGAFESESATLSLQLDTFVSTFVYPNPTANYVTIKSSKKVNLVTVYSATGKEVFKIKNQNRIDLSRLPNGIYFLCIELDTQSVVKKIMKK
ncbi:T9SS type A sorting domain-containing protein [Lacinutrix jangbogonensis]|uniref:T9SS type A sorting domain-containing protein n=1 Tax=Lacinutrix jangbogonensis TaxID=1469557 RepID=UPI00053EEC37|nr:T9SS type A sorting domain-containing protein [Lacinutrix jangbogonensis]